MKLNYRDFFYHTDDLNIIKEELSNLNESDLSHYNGLDYINPEKSKGLTDDQKEAFIDLLLAIMALKDAGKKDGEIAEIIEDLRTKSQENLNKNPPSQIEYLEVDGTKYRMDFGVSKNNIEYNIISLITDYNKAVNKVSGHRPGEETDYLNAAAKEIVDSNLELFKPGKPQKDITSELVKLFLDKIKEENPSLKIGRHELYNFLKTNYPVNLTPEQEEFIINKYKEYKGNKKLVSGHANILADFRKQFPGVEITVDSLKKILSDSGLTRKVNRRPTSVVAVALIQMYWPHIQRDTTPLVDEQGSKILDGWSIKQGDEGIPNPNNKISIKQLSNISKISRSTIQKLFKNMIAKNPKLNLQTNPSGVNVSRTTKSRDTSGTGTNRDMSVHLGDIQNNFNTMVRNLRNAHNIR